MVPPRWIPQSHLSWSVRQHCFPLETYWKQHEAGDERGVGSGSLFFPLSFHFFSSPLSSKSDPSPFIFFVLLQDEDEADAEDYELSRRADEDEGGPLRPDHPDEEDDSDDDVKRTRKQQASAAGGVEDNRVVFALDDDEDEDEEDETPKPRRQKKDSEEGGYHVDANEREEAGEGERLVGGAGGSTSRRTKDD